MDPDSLKRYRTWFTGYCRTFPAETEEDRKNYLLKEIHTHAVCENASIIARELALGDRERSVAGAVGLFHDVGRFPQYRDYRTYRDSTSKNHAALGARVLLEEGVLQDMPAEDRNVTVRAVTLHNVFTLPDGLPERVLLHSRIIRDADKLDIWRVFIELLAMPRAERPTAAVLSLPETPDYSPEVLPALEQRKLVRLDQLRTLNDFKLLQLAWIYDLNFLPSLRMVRDRGIIRKLTETLPSAPRVLRAVETLRRYMDEKLAGGDRR